MNLRKMQVPPEVWESLVPSEGALASLTLQPRVLDLG